MIPNQVISNAEMVLANCKGSNGMRASADVKTNYDAYFTRDTAINVLGLCLTGEKAFLPDLLVQLRQLQFFQGQEGQIASNFKSSPHSGIELSFGTLTPKLDGPSWFVIAACKLIEEGFIAKFEWQASIEKALSVLDAMDYNGNGLIFCPMGSDWADEYVCQGYVLHVQLLRAWALSKAGLIFDKKRYIELSDKIKTVIKGCFVSSENEDAKERYLIASSFAQLRFNQLDFASNVLYAHVFPECDLSAEILKTLRTRFLEKGILPPAFDPQIKEGEEQWGALRSFHLFEFKNMPGHYHNGGAWWIWVGWYALVLRQHGLENDIISLKEQVQQFFENQIDFEFSEYVTPKGEEGGQKQMAFTAAGLSMMQRIFTEDD